MDFRLGAAPYDGDVGATPGGSGIVIDSAFDGGNIRVLRIADGRADLEIVRDAGSDVAQWFSFRLDGAPGPLRLRITNAGQSSFPAGWSGYGVRASTDGVAWRMLPTRYADGVLEWDWPGGAVAFATFAPHTLARHDALLARASAMPGVTRRVLGTSLEGRPLDALAVGDGPVPVWLIARQHPGEPMGGWWMEGALARLTDAAAAPLRARATVHLVPNMNPDGTRRGHLRGNAAGVDLNRAWHAPTRERSPEVLCVRDAMDATGVAIAIDVHGDEAIPAPFLVGFEGVPSWTPERGARLDAFKRDLLARTADFQTARGYGAPAAGKANMAICTNQLAERFGALAMTLEMPFKDFDGNPDPAHGWSPARSAALGAACVDALAEAVARP